MKYNSVKEFKILGFTSKDNIQRYTYMSATDIVVAPPHDKDSQIGLSSLVQACKETNRVIIARFVKMANRNPYLCVLSPYTEYNNNEIEFEGFLINYLPFSDDCREYEFKSLQNIPISSGIIIII